MKNQVILQTFPAAMEGAPNIIYLVVHVVVVGGGAYLGTRTICQHFYGNNRDFKAGGIIQS